MLSFAARSGRPSPRHLRCAAAWVTAAALGLASLPSVALAAPPESESPAPAPAPAVSGAESSVKMAIQPLVVEGELPDTDRETLTTELVEGLQRGSFEVVTPDQVVELAGDSDCAKARCLAKIAEKTGATHIVRATVEVVDRDYTIKVELFDGSDGTTVVTSSDGCEICGVADVGELMQTQAATLRTKLDALASGPAAIIVKTDPEGAEVTLDGEPYGTTPLDKPIIPGDHVIRVSKDGYISVQEKRTFVEGAREALSYELEKVPNRLPKRPWGFASLGLGIGLIGAAGAMTWLHDKEYKFGDACTGENIDNQDDCRYLHNTKWWGMGLGLAGGALLTLGIAVLITTSKGPTKKKAKAAAQRLRVGPGGVGIAF